MICDDLIPPSDSNAFLTSEVDYSIYDTSPYYSISSPEEKKFFDKVLGLRVSISDDPEIFTMDTIQNEEDQTVPTKSTELNFNSVASPASVLGGDGPESSQDNIRAPPPSYEEHKVFSKFHPQNFSREDLAARWRDIQDIITRESSVLGDGPLSLSVLKPVPRPIMTDDPIHSPTYIDISSIADTSVNSSIAQSPAWYSNSVQESSFYSTSPESNSLVPPPRSSNSSPASTAGSFAPPFNNYSASPASNTTFFDLSSRCTPSPLCKQNNNNNNSNNPTTTTTTSESSGMICGMSYQQLKAHIPESGHIQLWQFLIKLLCEPENENCIRWEGIKGHFNIVNQNELAKRWGDRKRRKHMTYEKLSRAIRYYYDKNYVQKIHGKKATYVFNFEELFKSQSRPSQQKSKESAEGSGMSAPIKIPSYQKSPSSSSSPSSSYRSCAQNSSLGNKTSLSAATYSSEMNSYVEYGMPQQAKEMKAAFETYGNQIQQYYGQEQDYNTNLSYTSNIHPYFDDDNILSYY